MLDTALIYIFKNLKLKFVFIHVNTIIKSLMVDEVQKKKLRLITAGRNQTFV